MDIRQQVRTMLHTADDLMDRREYGQAITLALSTLVDAKGSGDDNPATVG